MIYELTFNDPNRPAGHTPTFLTIIRRVGTLLPDDVNPFRAGQYSEQDIRWSERFPEEEGTAAYYVERYLHNDRSYYVRVNREEGHSTFVTTDALFLAVVRAAAKECGFQPIAQNLK